MNQAARPHKGRNRCSASGEVRRWRGRGTLVGLAAVLLTAGVAAGQSPVGFSPEAYEPDPLPPLPGWATQVGLLGANALIGGVTAGVWQKTRGGSFRDGFTRGAAGGGVVFAGKRIAVERFDGAGLLGRSVAATGSSMVRNASDGEPILARVMLPVGPLRLYVDRTGGPKLRAKVDLNTLAVVAYAAATADLDFDLGASLSAGAPVFRTFEHVFGTPADSLRGAGKVVEGVIFLSDLPWRHPRETQEIFAHERVHVLQGDQVFLPLAEPLSARAVRVVPGLATLYRYVDLHTTELIFEILTVPFPRHENRPWEIEAYRLMRR